MERCSKPAKFDSSLDESLTNIQWLYHLDLPENLLGQKNTNLNTETKGKMEEGSNKKDTEPSPKNPHSKPSYSYSTLILLAINSSREKKMTLQEIYKWIEDNFPFYKKCKKAWKNSIRHNLSLHSYFIKEQRPSGLPGKGNYWCLSSEGKENIVKEVMKHSQPVLHIPYQIQTSATGSANGLRPILPKPSIDSSASLSNRGILGNIGILANGVQYSLPVVFVTNTGVNESISGTAEPQGADVKLLPKCAEGVSVMVSETKQLNILKDKNSNHSLVRQNLTEYEMPSEEISKSDEAIPNVTFTGMKDATKNSFPSQHNSEPKCVQEAFSISAAQSTSKSDKNEGNVTLKRRHSCETKDQLISSPKNAKQFNNRKTSPSLQVCGTRRSPFRNCSQPTLAAINSQTSDGVGTASECRQFFEDFGGVTSSPIKPISTPLKEGIQGSLNTPNWLSPLGSGFIGFNTKTGLTPLKYDSDSGFFTPVKDGEFDFNFLLSPNHLVVDPSPRSKTKQGCRKSLHLGTIKEDEAETEQSLLDWLQI